VTVATGNARRSPTPYKPEKRENYAVATSAAPTGRKKKIRAALIASETQCVASICHAASGDLLHIEPIENVRSLSRRDCERSDAVLVWTSCQSIQAVFAHLAGMDKWPPVIAMAQSASTADVVQAMRAGAIDFLVWPCRPIDLVASIVRGQSIGAGMTVAHERMREARARLERLSARQTQVLSSMAQGLSNKQIAQHLQISDRTVEIHRACMLRKLEAASSAEAVRWLLEATLPSGWVRGEEGWFAPWSFEALVMANGPKRLAF
jgi:two-component system response regulator FixJ